MAIIDQSVQDEFTLDFTGVVSYINPPTGWYEAVLHDAKLGKNKAGDKDMWTITFKIPSLNGLVSTRIVNEATSLFRMRDLLMALGVSSEQMTGRFKFRPDDYKGKPLMIQIVTEIREGQTEERADVRQYRPEGAIEADAPEAEKEPVSARKKAANF